MKKYKRGFTPLTIGEPPLKTFSKSFLLTTIFNLLAYSNQLKHYTSVVCGDHSNQHGNR